MTFADVYVPEKATCRNQDGWVHLGRYPDSAKKISVFDKVCDNTGGWFQTSVEKNGVLALHVEEEKERIVLRMHSKWVGLYCAPPFPACFPYVLFYPPHLCFFSSTSCSLRLLHAT